MALNTRSVVATPQGLVLLHGEWTIEHDGEMRRGISTEVVRRQADGTWLFVIDKPYTPE